MAGETAEKGPSEIRSMFCHEIGTFSGSLVIRCSNNGEMSLVSGLMMPLPRLNNQINPRSIKCSPNLQFASTSGNKKLWQVTLTFLQRFVCRLGEFQDWTQIGILLTQIKTFVGSIKFTALAPIPDNSKHAHLRSQRHEYVQLMRVRVS